jgi:hypothetical protein
MHDLSNELRKLPDDAQLDAARARALRIEGRQDMSVRNELLLAMYVAVATLIAGVGLLVKANLDRIGPMALLIGIFTASALCYLVALRPRNAQRDRTLGEDYILLLGALLFSAAVGYAEFRFHVLGSSWSRHLLLLAVWHLASAYLFRSRLVLAVALTAFAGWLGVETRLGTLANPLHPLFGTGFRALLCALLFYAGSRLHLAEEADISTGFRDVYRQFAVNFGFWGALALGADSSTRWIGALVLIALAVLVGRAGMKERRESFVLYAVGYCTIGLVWLEALMLHDFLLISWIGLATVIGAGMLLFSLRSRLKESAP